MTFFCVYPIYIIRRTWFAKQISGSWLVNYLHLITFVVVLLVDVGVFIKVTF